MIIVDANLLIYAVNSAAKEHTAARKWLDERLSGTEEVAFPWPVIVAFLRITTHPGLFPRPLSIRAAVGKIQAWLGQPVARVLDPGDGHMARLAELLQETKCTGNLVQDAHLAALAMENGAVLCSTDVDFSRFPRLNWVNPLSDPGEK